MKFITTTGLVKWKGGTSGRPSSRIITLFVCSLPSGIVAGAWYWSPSFKVIPIWERLLLIGLIVVANMRIDPAAPYVPKPGDWAKSERWPPCNGEIGLVQDDKVLPGCKVFFLYSSPGYAWYWPSDYITLISR